MRGKYDSTVLLAQNDGRRRGENVVDAKLFLPFEYTTDTGPKRWRSTASWSAPMDNGRP